jgi:hypothetical protein
MIGTKPYTLNKVRYLNKYNNDNERENYSLWWKELIEHYGTRTDYFTHGYSLSSHNFLYGEDATSKYLSASDVIMMTDITNDSLMLSKFGIMADCDMTAVIHISSFWEKFGYNHEPKAGDLIKLSEYGMLRPGGRSAPIYEITERDDENVTLTNSLLGHYVWFLKCKRYEYSYEPGIREAPASKQVSDGGDYGRLPGGANPEELFQPYPDSANNSAKCIYDYYEHDITCTQPPNHFIPPQEPPHVPYPLVEQPFTAELQHNLNATLSSAEAMASFINQNSDNILFRRLANEDNGVKTFVIETSGKALDDIVYSTEMGSVDIFNINGGTSGGTF